MREIERHIGGPALACMRGSLLWPSTLLGGVSIQKTTVGPQAATWGSISVLRFEARRPQAGLGEVLHRTRLFHLAVLNRRSASLWPTKNRWFFGKASTRSSRLLHRTGHQLTMPLRGSATLTPKNNRESYSRSKREEDSR